MIKKKVASSPLPEGFNPCTNCVPGSDGSYTRITLKPEKFGGDQKHILCHWCDRGRPLTSAESFCRGGPDRLADIRIIVPQHEDASNIAAVWNALNAVPKK